MNCNNCFLYVAGLLTAFAYDDISYNKIATQSKTYDGQGYDASNAVDRNTATCMRTDPIGVTNPGKTTWWKVDLGGVSSIYSVNIQFKSYDGYVDRQKGRLAGFSLYVSNSDVKSPDDIKKTTLCYKDGPELPPLNLTKKCMEYGRYVIFYNERLDGIAYPEKYEVTSVFTELCEVNIKGCSNASFYGINCDTPCPTNCKDNTCQIENGACSLCKPGWTGLDCKLKCREGWYGTNCTKQCVGHCKNGATCNHVTGFCDRGCAAGWKGNLCNEECDDGTYGYNCTNNCSGHCLNDSPCNKQTGHCDRGCNPGYTTSDCSKECLPGYFGIDCSRKCGGHCINNEACDHVSGVCPSGCQDGFVGTQCNKSCNEGYFGTNCSYVCSPNCQPGKCQHTDGSCSSCVEGWMGSNCTTECMLSYGDNCQYLCNVHCINQTCDRINGSCLYGCKEEAKCGTDNVKDISSASSSNNLPVTVGILMSACILIIIGVVITILVLRQRSSRTISNTSVCRVCFKSAPAAEESVKSENLSNYQELNFALQENPYQSMSR